MWSSCPCVKKMPDFLLVLHEIGVIGNDRIHPGHILAVGEGEPCVDDDDVVPVFEGGHVFPDFPHTAEEEDFYRSLLFRMRSFSLVFLHGGRLFHILAALCRFHGRLFPLFQDGVDCLTRFRCFSPFPLGFFLRRLGRLLTSDLVHGQHSFLAFRFFALKNRRLGARIKRGAHGIPLPAVKTGFHRGNFFLTLYRSILSFFFHFLLFLLTRSYVYTTTIKERAENMGIISSLSLFKYLL